MKDWKISYHLIKLFDDSNFHDLQNPNFKTKNKFDGTRVYSAIQISVKKTNKLPSGEINGP